MQDDVDLFPHHTGIEKEQLYSALAHIRRTGIAPPVPTEDDRIKAALPAALDLDLGHGNIAEEFDDAFAKAQASFAPVVRNREVEVLMKSGGKYKYKYAELDQIFAATKPALNAQGISIRQRVKIDSNGGYWVTTQLRFKGFKVEDDFPLFKPQSNHPQDFNGAVTYAKRGGLQAALGVAAEDDNDGEGAGSLTTPPKVHKRSNDKEAVRQAAEDAAFGQPHKGHESEGSQTKLATEPEPVYTEAEIMDFETILTDVSDEMLQAAAEGRRVGIEQIWAEIDGKSPKGKEWIKTRLWNYMKTQHKDHFKTMRDVLRPANKTARGPKPTDDSVPL